VWSVAVECHDLLRPSASETCRRILTSRGFKCELRQVSTQGKIKMLYGWK
jgi:hypothetical protein